MLVGWWHEAAFLSELARERGLAFAMVAAASYRQIFGRLKRRRFAWVLQRPLERADVVFVRSEFTRRELSELMGIDEASACASFPAACVRASSTIPRGDAEPIEPAAVLRQL